MAVGHDRDVALGDAGQKVVELARVKQRAVAGKQGDALRAERLGPCDPGQRRLAVAEIGGVGEDLSTRRLGQLGRPLLAGDDDHCLDRAGPANRLQDVGQHRRDQLLAAGPLDPGGEASLRRPKALHREYSRRVQAGARLAA